MNATFCDQVNIARTEHSKVGQTTYDLSRRSVRRKID